MKGLTVSVSSSLRQNLPFDHITAALILSKKVKEIENQYILEKTNNISSVHKAYTLSCIYLIVGFLETSINDLYANAKDNLKEHLVGIESHIKILSEFNEKQLYKNLDKYIKENSKSNIIRKYQYTLQLLKIPFIDIDDQALLDITTVIHIRNYVSHHFAEWLKCGSDVQTPYDYLKGRFEENPIYKNSGNPFFPDKVLGYGFIQWAIKLSVEFVKKFYDKIGLQYFFIKQLENIEKENIIN